VVQKGARSLDRRDWPGSADLASRTNRRGGSFTGHGRERQRGDRAVCRRGFRMRYRTTNLGSVLVLARTFVDDLPEQIVVGPGQEFNLGDQLGLHSVHAAEHERRTEAVRSRSR
jgi:hypothetical protein